MGDEDSQEGSGTNRQSASQEKRTPWYNSIVWGPIVIALIGAMMQITNTIIPITFGTAGESDFSVAISPGIDNIFVYSKTGFTNVSENISVIDIHKYIKPYKHPVYVKLIRETVPPGVKITLQNRGAGPLPITTQMNITIDHSKYKSGEYEIIIKAIGEDGFFRNGTYFLSLDNKTTTESEGYRTYSSINPVGYVRGGLYLDINGNLLTRDEYIDKYGIDPKVYLSSKTASMAEG